MIVGQVDPSIPVYQTQRESGIGNVKTVHRNLLLPLSLPLDPQITPVLPINKDRARNEEPPTRSLQSDDDDDDWVQITTQRDPDIDVDSSSQHDSYKSDVSEESEESDNHEDGNSGHIICSLETIQIMIQGHHLFLCTYLVYFESSNRL